VKSIFHFLPLSLSHMQISQIMCHHQAKILSEWNLNSFAHNKVWRWLKIYAIQTWTQGGETQLQRLGLWWISWGSVTLVINLEEFPYYCHVGTLLMTAVVWGRRRACTVERPFLTTFFFLKNHDLEGMHCGSQTECSEWIIYIHGLYIA